MPGAVREAARLANSLEVLRPSSFTLVAIGPVRTVLVIVRLEDEQIIYNLPLIAFCVIGWFLTASAAAEASTLDLLVSSWGNS